jgi:hypothetical protein
MPLPARRSTVGSTRVLPAIAGSSRPATPFSGSATPQTIRRAPILSEEERTRMLDGVVTIEAMVLGMVALIDAMRNVGGDGGANPQ